MLATLTLAARLGAAGGAVEGRVALSQAVCAPMVTEHYCIMASNGVMATNPPLAVVYVEGEFPQPEKPATVELVQKDLAFVPALLPVRVGTRVKFPNLDKIYHNVYSYSRVKRFDLGRYPPGEEPVPEQLFDHPGLVTVRCEIHEHMRGLILVLDTPYFVTTDAEGRFRISGLPPGHYRLKAWVSSEVTRELPLEITGDATVHMDFP